MPYAYPNHNSPITQTVSSYSHCWEQVLSEYHLASCQRTNWDPWDNLSPITGRLKFFFQLRYLAFLSICCPVPSLQFSSLQIFLFRIFLRLFFVLSSTHFPPTFIMVKMSFSSTTQYAAVAAGKKTLFRCLWPVFRPSGHASDEPQTSLVFSTENHWWTLARLCNCLHRSSILPKLCQDMPGIFNPFNSSPSYLSCTFIFV